MKENEASATAFSVAQGILHTASHPALGSLVPLEMAAACHRILEGSPEGRRRLRQLANPLFRRAVPWLERLLMPGITLHYALRKRFMEEATRTALAAGVTQVVNLGSGFDTLAWRLHRDHPEVIFIEIDHPATSAIKVPSLLDGGAPPPNLQFLAVDLSRRGLAETLEGSPLFQGGRSTLFLCEGVLMYLPPPAVDTLLATLGQLCGPGTRFLFTAVEPTGSPANNTGPLLRLLLLFKGEPLAWSLPRSDLAPFLTQRGYRLLDQADDADLVARWLETPPPDPLHRGEYCALALIS